MKQFTVQETTSKVRRVTFASPPFNLIGADTMAELSAIIAGLSGEDQVSVVIFDSATPGYFLNHVDGDQIPAIADMAGAGGTERLTHLLGRDRTLEVLLTGQDYDADRAAQYGWVTRAVPDAELDDFVMRWPGVSPASTNRPSPRSRPR